MIVFFLNSGLFKPLVIILNIPLLPLVVVSFIVAANNNSIKWFIISSIMFFCYSLIMFVTYRYSKSKRYFIKIYNDKVKICSPNMSGNEQNITIEHRDIIKLEYFGLLSFNAWLMLFNYVCPQCVFITFLKDGEEHSKHIGYLNRKDFLQISRYGYFVCTKNNKNL